MLKEGAGCAKEVLGHLVITGYDCAHTVTSFRSCQEHQAMRARGDTLPPTMAGDMLTSVGAWRSTEAHLHGVQGVGGSNPLAPTNF